MLFPNGAASTLAWAFFVDKTTKQPKALSSAPTWMQIQRSVGWDDTTYTQMSGDMSSTSVVGLYVFKITTPSIESFHYYGGPAWSDTNAELAAMSPTTPGVWWKEAMIDESISSRVAAEDYTALSADAVANAVWQFILAGGQKAQTLLGNLAVLALGTETGTVSETVSHDDNDGRCIKTSYGKTIGNFNGATQNVSVCGPGYCNQGLLLSFPLTGAIAEASAVLLHLSTPSSSSLICDVVIEASSSAAAPTISEDLTARTWTDALAVSQSFTDGALTIDLTATVATALATAGELSRVNVWLKPTDGGTHYVDMNDGTTPPQLDVEGTGLAWTLSKLQEAVSDALLLAPSAGTAAAGSAMAELDGLRDAIEDGLDELEAALLSGLTGATVTVVSSVVGGTITVYVADTWRFTVASDELDLADYETVALVVKRNARQADNQALLYVRSDTGLARVGGAAPVSAGNGVLTKGASSFTAVVHVAETQGLVPGGYSWWLKGMDTTPAPDEAVTLATGEFVVLAAGLQAVV